MTLYLVLRVMKDEEKRPQGDEGEQADEPEEHRDVQLILVVDLSGHVNKQNGP